MVVIAPGINSLIFSISGAVHSALPKGWFASRSSVAFGRKGKERRKGGKEGRREVKKDIKKEGREKEEMVDGRAERREKR